MSSKKTSGAQVRWSESGLPISCQFEDPYFCKESGLAESRYVFLQQNHLHERFKQHQGVFTVLETGFGSGLNFLTCAKLFSETCHADAWLHYFSIEKYPLSHTDLAKALALWPELADEANALLADYPLLNTGYHTFNWPAKRISLTLAFDDVNKVLPQFNHKVDAWFLDGFAPSKNPEMWSDDLFKQMGRISALSVNMANSETSSPPSPPTFATFTASGLVRRGLLGAGFKVEKAKGFGNKRHMLKGVYQKTQGAVEADYFKTQGWHLPSPIFAKNRQVRIVGAGLAGCATAYALAIRGYQVTVMDKNGVAQGASGNPVGGLYIKLAIDEQSLHNQFYLAGYTYSINLLNKLLDEQHFQSCGLLQLGYNEKEAARQQAFLTQTTLPKTLVKPSSYNQKFALSFPLGGWVSPVHLCQALLDHKNITLVNDELIEFSSNSTGIELTNINTHSHTDILIIACANEAKALLGEHVISTKAIRGQISYLDASQAPPLEQVLCGSGYLAPAKDGFHCLGASYHIGDEEPNIRAEDHASNLEILNEFDESWQACANMDAVIGGRVSQRCSSSDYLPLAGALIEPKSFEHDFTGLKHQAKRVIKKSVAYEHGLYLNVGHGSRGLSSALLCGEVIARQIHGEPAPLSQAVMDAVSPNRFLIRKLIRKS